MPPTLSVCNTDSLGEQIQRVLPGVPGREGAEHDELHRDGRPGLGARRSQRLRLRLLRRGEAGRDRAARELRLAARRGSSTSATSPPRGAWRCTSRSGCASTAPPAGRTSTSPSARRPDELAEQPLELLGRLAAEPGVHLGRLDDRARRRDEPVEARRRVELRDRAGGRVAGGDALDRLEVRRAPSPGRGRARARRACARRGASARRGSRAAGRRR